MEKKFKVVYRPFPESDMTQTHEMFGVDEDDVRKNFNRYFVGEIVSVEEQ